VLTAYFELRDVPESGSALSAFAPEEPRAAATAILRIETLAAQAFAKPLSIRRLSETENSISASSR
jgi:hypothetical protein